MSLLLATKKSSLPTPEYAVGLKAIRGFAGDIITARETGGDTEQSFTASEVVGSGAGSLDYFIGANDARVKFLLNQGSLALTNELGQTTNPDQPAIATSGTVLTDSNGNPYVRFTTDPFEILQTTDSTLLDAITTPTHLDFSGFMCYEYKSSSAIMTYLFELRSNDLYNDVFELMQTTDAYRFGNNDRFRIHYDDAGDGQTNDFLGAANITAINTQYIISFFFVSGVFYLYLDGTLVGSIDYNPVNNFVPDFLRLNGFEADWWMKELQLYSGDQRANITAINNDILTRWS